MEPRVTPYPIDFDALKKGNVLPAELLERITNEKRGTDDYRFKVMKLCERIKTEMAERGCPVTISTRGADVRILTDEEASPHNEMLVKQDVVRIFRHFRQLCVVDSSSFSDDQKTEHERRVITLGRYAQAVKDVKKQLSVEPTTRQLPGLSGKPV